MQPSCFDYVQYDQEATAQQAEIKDLCQKLEAVIEKLGEGRPQAYAITHLEVTYVWCGKAIRDLQIKRNGSASLQESRTNS